METSFRNITRWKSFRDSYDLLAAGNGVHDAVYIDRYHETLKYILDGHEQEGIQRYKPYHDRYATVLEKDGKQVFARRAPHFDAFTPLIVAAGYGDDVALNDGRACFCLLRKLTPDSMFDR